MYDHTVLRREGVKDEEGLWKGGLMKEDIIEGRVLCMMKTLWKIGQMHKGIIERVVIHEEFMEGRTDA